MRITDFYCSLRPHCTSIHLQLRLDTHAVSTYGCAFIDHLQLINLYRMWSPRPEEGPCYQQFPKYTTGFFIVCGPTMTHCMCCCSPPWILIIFFVLSAIKCHIIKNCVRKRVIHMITTVARSIGIGFFRVAGFFDAEFPMDDVIGCFKLSLIHFVVKIRGDRTS